MMLVSLASATKLKQSGDEDRHNKKSRRRSNSKSKLSDPNEIEIKNVSQKHDTLKFTKFNFDRSFSSVETRTTKQSDVSGGNNKIRIRRRSSNVENNVKSSDPDIIQSVRLDFNNSQKDKLVLEFKRMRFHKNPHLSSSVSSTKNEKIK